MLLSDSLIHVYNTLRKENGFLNWWPGETREEIIIGAILTQNTNWKNVEKAIKALKKEGVIDFLQIEEADNEHLAALIRPSGYFNQKAIKLKKTAVFFNEFGFESFGGLKLKKAREKLLSIWGIGPETADSILLYAFEFPVFVVDAYTRRVFSRHGLWPEKVGYDLMQGVFMDNLEHDPILFNDFHAQIVELCKNYCKKRAPLCDKCPLDANLNLGNEP